MSRAQTPLNYAEYLRLPNLLACQQRKSELSGRPAHDEMLFIIVHQAYELWFKQILFELDAVQAVFARSPVDDHAIGQAARGLRRIVEIEKLLVHQLDVLETMTPLDFLDFHDLLIPASGFQSVQFRLIEIRLGLDREARLQIDQRAYDSPLTADERQRLRAAESEPRLFRQVEAWLERTPFVTFGDYDFQRAYLDAVRRALEREAGLLRANQALGVEERQAELDSLARARARFDAIFDRDRHAELVADGEWRLSERALQAALFINLYRDEPALQLPFGLLGLLMDIDEVMTTWRYRHALMVERMIGLRMGTGGSSGHGYLRRTAEQHRVFGDLFALSTFFIPRSQLPDLPEALHRAMSYRYDGSGR